MRRPNYYDGRFGIGTSGIGTRKVAGNDQASGSRRCWYFALAVFMAAVDGTVISVAGAHHRTASSELQPDPVDRRRLPFVLAGLLITMGMWGRIGRKRLLLISVSRSGIASAAAAFAPRPACSSWLVSFRGVAGLGLMPSTLALLRTVFTDERQRTRRWNLGASAGGAALGPTVAACS